MTGDPETIEVVDASRVGTKGYPRHYAALGLQPPKKFELLLPGSPPIELSLGAAVDAERDRRIATLFAFGGVAYQLAADSQRFVTAKGAQAKFAILAGAQPGDLRWANPDKDFGWIATDNSVTPMDAQTMAAFADLADLWVTAHIMAGHTLKAMDPIPADFADDRYWPARAD